MIIPPKMSERGPLKRYAREYNKLRDYVRSGLPVGGRNVRVQQSPRGRIIQAQPGGKKTAAPTQIAIGRFEVVSVGDTYLNCTYAGYDTDNFPSGEIVIYKPFYLRPPGIVPHVYYDITYFADSSVANSNGRTGQALLDGHTLRWQERIMPPYVSADDEGTTGNIKFIFAANMEGQTSTVEQWFDINVDGRTWQQVARAYAVCVAGDAQYVALFGGEPSAV